MGWMNDTLSYVPIPFDCRENDHRKLTFSLLYAFDERYCLPISHDEVVHGKKSLLDRMDGDYWRKFAHTRSYLGYMISHPGKKLLFMGSELGQFTEWNYKKECEWFLLDYDAHRSFQHYVSDLNHFYLANPPLFDNDQSWQGFRWMDADNANQSVLSYVRYDREGNFLLIVVNFRPWAYENYKIGAPTHGIYQEVFNSDKAEYGGSGVTNDAPITTLLESTAQGEYSLPIRLPPLGFAVFRCTKDLNRLKSQEVRKKESKPAPKKKTAKKKTKA
jgi:1,4-alpha-glucan branching enzyme